MIDDVGPARRSAGNVGPKPPPSPLLPILQRNQPIVDWLAAITGQPTSVVFERLRSEHFDLGANVRTDLEGRNLDPFVWSAGLAEFYQESDAFLYENIAFNRTGAKCRMRAWIGAFLAGRFPDGARVLIYGDGAGFDSLYLALAGHGVTYSEPGGLASEFARRLHAAAGRALTVAAPDSIARFAPYDAVICLDVLEHLPDPPATVMELSRVLSPHGYLVVHAPFFFLNRQCPTHLQSNLRYSGDLEALCAHTGLRPVDGRLFWDPIVLERRTKSGTGAGGSPLRGKKGYRLRLGGIGLRLMRIFHPLPLRLVELALWRDRRQLRQAFRLGGGC